jgi:hypothetical protein
MRLHTSSTGMNCRKKAWRKNSRRRRVGWHDMVAADESYVGLPKAYAPEEIVRVRAEEIARAGEGLNDAMMLALDNISPGLLTQAELNDQIRNVLLTKAGAYNPSWCGTPDRNWHHDCIGLALYAKYAETQPFVWRRVPNEAIYDRKRTNKLYVFGILNSKHFPTSDPSGDWTHSICVNPKTNRFFDDNARARHVNYWFLCDAAEQYMKVQLVYEFAFLQKYYQQNTNTKQLH